MADYMTVQESTLPTASEAEVTHYRVNSTGDSERIAKADVRFPASQITNNSSVEGATVKDALETLDRDIDTHGAGKLNTTTQVIAGDGLTGGGTLSTDRTLSVGATDDSIVVAADGIKVDTQNVLNSTSTTKPLSAAQGKALNDTKENTSNKKTTLSYSDTAFPTSKAVLNGSISTALAQAGINLPDDTEYFGYYWARSQADDTVTFINDTAADSSGVAPVGSKRAAYLNTVLPFECTYDMGTVNYLNANVNYLADGVTPSHLTDPLYLQMVKFPAIYFKYAVTGVYTIILFSTIPRAGWDLIPSFAYARYRGTISGGKLLSYANLQNPSDSMTLINAQTYARAVNAACDVTSCWHWNIMALMMVLDTGRFNAQAFWRGAVDASSAYSSSIPCGKTNALTTPNGVGASYTVNVSGTDYTVAPFRWRYIENLYGGIWNMAIGGYATHAVGDAFMKMYLAKSRLNCNTNSVLTGHDYLGNMPFTGGYVKEFIAGTIFPASVGGGSATYKCDYYYCDTTNSTRTNSLVFGGPPFDGSASGPFYVASDWSTSYSLAYVGASLMITEFTL